jgi:diguanylate cyclase (GGDEF)-like protein/PAS domain S-box-containing protein
MFSTERDKGTVVLKLTDIKPYSSDLLRHFLAAFVPFSLSLAAFLFAYTWLEKNQTLESVSKSEAIRIEAARNASQATLNEAVADISMLGREAALRYWADRPDIGTLGDLTNQLLLMSRTKRIYDQIRLLSKDGQEIVRVNFNNGQPYSVPWGELQNKADRYYFKESVGLRPGQVFLSPMDLNVENNAIERPFKPTIRLASPVYDSQGGVRGVLVLNYLAQAVLEKMSEAAYGIEGDLMLVNADGFWLLNPKHEDEWGFQLNTGKSFAKLHPDAWDRLSQGQRQIHDGKGLYSAAALKPASTFGRLPGHADQPAISTGATPPESYVWWLISYIPANRLKAVLTDAADTHVVYVFALFLIGVLSFSYSLMRVARIRSDEELKQAAKVMEVTHDGVLILCPNRRILSANQAAAKITGYLPSELTGADEHIMRAHKDDSELNDVIWRQVEDHGQWQGEIWNRRKNGEAYPAYVTIGRITDRKGHLQNYIKIFADITDRKLEEQALLKLAHHDPLTGLPNRALFMDRLEVALASAKRAGHKAAVMFIDLDKFKPVNDELGHEAGDILLCEIARRLQGALREADTVARFGGDEFVVLLPNLEHDHDALAVAATLIERVREEFSVKGRVCQVGCSIGIAFYPMDAEEPSRLVERADQAMYRAKQAGSGSVRMAGRELPEQPVPSRRYLKSVT